MFINPSTNFIYPSINVKWQFHVRPLLIPARPTFLKISTTTPILISSMTRIIATMSPLSSTIKIFADFSCTSLEHSTKHVQRFINKRKLLLFKTFNHTSPEMLSSTNPGLTNLPNSAVTYRNIVPSRPNIFSHSSYILLSTTRTRKRSSSLSLT